MATTYIEANDDAQDLLTQTVQEFHPDFTGASELTFNFLFAQRFGAKTGVELPAIVVKGIQLPGTIKITSVQDRARGVADAKIVIDRVRWDALSHTRKIALLDHLVSRLKLVMARPSKKVAGGLKRDECGRPVIRIRPYDWQLQGFEDVVQRHGEASYETTQFRGFEESYGQLMLFDPEEFTKAVSTVCKACRQRKHKRCTLPCSCPKCHPPVEQDSRAGLQ